MAKEVDELIRYAILNEIRNIYRQYHPGRKEALDEARVVTPRYNKDGSLSKLYYVHWQCCLCGVSCNIKERDVDHMIPVGEIPKYPFESGKLEAWIGRLFCTKENLRVLCKECHKKKTAQEARERSNKK